MSGNLGVGSRQHSAITTWVWSISCLLLMGELIGDQAGSSSREGHSAIQMGLPCMLQAPLGRARGRGGHEEEWMVQIYSGDGSRGPGRGEAQR